MRIRLQNRKTIAAQGFDGGIFSVDTRQKPSQTIRLRRSACRSFFDSPFRLIVRALNNDGTEALLAAPFAFSAKLVIFLPATLIKKERPFFLEIFRHTGHSEHLLFTAELPICSRNAETPKTVSRCMVSGRFWAFSFDMSGFVLAAVSLPPTIQKPLFVTSG